jgi:mono/diheme cytochrome c family protein
MKKVLLALVLIPAFAALAAAQTPPPAGDQAAGKALWDGNTTSCKNCHGTNAEGGYGPDLAGRKLTYAQFQHAVQKPWGVMPSFPQFNDKQLADLYTYVSNLPGVREAAAWRFPLPENAPKGQVVALATIGCAQCHTPILDTPRRGIAEANGDFEWFKHMVYDHTKAMPEHCAAVGPGNPYCRAVRMGDYSRTRLQEDQLRQIYDWAVGLGLEIPIEGNISDAEPAGTGATYKLNVTNKGVQADSVTIAVIVPAGVKVVTTTGEGYKGVRADKQAKANVAEWQVAKLTPNDKQAYSITLSKALPASEHLKGSIHWMTRGGRPAGPKDFVEIGGEEKKPEGGRGGAPAEGGRGGRGAAPTPPTQ